MPIILLLFYTLFFPTRTVELFYWFQPMSSCDKFYLNLITTVDLVSFQKYEEMCSTKYNISVYNMEYFASFKLTSLNERKNPNENAFYFMK